MEEDQNPEIDEQRLATEIFYLTSRSRGPGGQHVNKTETRVELRWNIHTSSLFSDKEKEVLIQQLSGKITLEGDLRILSQETRSQNKNKQLAFQKLIHTLQEALTPEKERKPTKPAKAVKEKRLTEKKKQSEKKERRKNPEL